MKGFGLLLLVLVLALTAAKVAKDRRALISEELKASGDTGKFCDQMTPCGWSVYSPGTKHIELNITNSYCTCNNGTVCRRAEDDDAASAYINRCRLPNEVIDLDS